jgi:hypothetical protein
MTTTTVVPGQNHVRIWMNPHPIMAIKAQSSTEALPETDFYQTPKSLRCHHLYWPRSLQLNLLDQESHVLYRITRKAISLTRQYKFPLVLSATLRLSYGIRYIESLLTIPAGSDVFVVTLLNFRAGGLGSVSTCGVCCHTLSPVTQGACPTHCPTRVCWSMRTLVRFTYVVVGGIWGGESVKGLL